jgi:tripartite-type tricarboxylate transporter receptor subunit TctC
VKKQTHRLAALCVALCMTSSASAQSVQDFYRGKQIRLISGHPVGGDYDVGARFLAKHLQKHIPGQPAVIVQNMPQAATWRRTTAPSSARSRAISPARP